MTTQITVSREDGDIFLMKNKQDLVEGEGKKEIKLSFKFPDQITG